MKVVYITLPFFFDYSVEIINELKKEVDLYVYTVITPYSLKSTIIDLEIESEEYKFYDLEECSNDDYLVKISDYLNGCKDFKFVMFPKKDLSIKALKRSYKFGNFIGDINPDIIHFESLSTAFIGMLPSIYRKKVVINIHDPEPHSGEENWRTKLIRSLFFPRTDQFILFSDYSRNQFIKAYKPKGIVSNTRLVPYNSYLRYKPKPIDLNIDFAKDYIILFYGRISKYKGVEILLGAFDIINRKYPNVKLIIAGKANYNYSIPKSLKNMIGTSLFIINRFITNEEVSFLMRESSVLVCPYKDATQSGVIMTALSFGLPVVASNVGGLPEYIQNNKNGVLLTVNNVNNLVKVLIDFLENNKRKKVFKIPNDLSIETNTNKIVALYNNLIVNK